MASYKLKDNGTYMFYFQRGLNVTAKEYSNTSNSKQSYFFFSPYASFQTTNNTQIESNRTNILLEQNPESV